MCFPMRPGRRWVFVNYGMDVVFVLLIISSTHRLHSGLRDLFGKGLHILISDLYFHYRSLFERSFSMLDVRSGVCGFQLNTRFILRSGKRVLADFGSS